jgi:hypothetical protein
MKSIAEKYPMQMPLPPKGFHKRRRIKPNMDEHLNKECAYLYELATKATPKEQGMIALMPTLLRMSEACYKLKKH